MTFHHHVIAAMRLNACDKCETALDILLELLILLQFVAIMISMFYASLLLKY